MLDSFSDRCRDRLRQHVNEVIENSARTATQAAAAAAAFGPESTSRASGKANGALSSFSVFYVDNYDMVMLSVELMSVGKMEHDEECLKEAQTLSERLLDSAFKNVEIVACDDSTRSLVIRAENYYCIAGGLGTINVQSMADMEKVARNTQERATTRYACMIKIPSPPSVEFYPMPLLSLLTKILLANLFSPCCNAKYQKNSKSCAETGVSTEF